MMEYRKLGNSNIKISVVSMGTLTMSPMQKNMTRKEGGKLIEDAEAAGINFFDSAEIYDTYKHIGAANLKNKTMIGAKSYAVSYKEMETSIAKALKETKRKYIDIFMLHQQESELTLKGHKEALKCLRDAKEKGIVRLSGISTHRISGVEAAAKHPDIDVIFAIFNYKGLGILDGNSAEMAKALGKAAELGKGILIMKGLGGGHCFREPDKAFSFLRNYPWISSVVIGMQNIDEIQANIALMHGKDIPKDVFQRLAVKKRRLNIEREGCQKCGSCVKKCDQKALTLTDDGIIINHDKCILCGYCASVCPEFCLEVV